MITVIALRVIGKALKKVETITYKNHTVERIYSPNGVVPEDINVLKPAPVSEIQHREVEMYNYHFGIQL